ncbi:MAG: hypothetical protein ACREVQ_12360 [Burkholderiales bacterium]
MSDPEIDARRARMRELLAIPDRERSDAEWDELNELEIMMAVTSRQAMPRADPPGGNGQGNRPRHGGGGGGGGGGQQHPGNPGRKFHNRPPRRRPPGR